MKDNIFYLLKKFLEGVKAFYLHEFDRDEAKEILDMRDENERQQARIAELEARIDELNDAWALDETIQPDGSLRPSISDTVHRYEERIAELEQALDDATSAIGSVIACCTYNSEEEARGGAYAINHKAFTKIDEFIRKLEHVYNHTDINHEMSVDVNEHSSSECSVTQNNTNHDFNSH